MPCQIARARPLNHRSPWPAADLENCRTDCIAFRAPTPRRFRRSFHLSIRRTRLHTQGRRRWFGQDGDWRYSWSEGSWYTVCIFRKSFQGAPAHVGVTGTSSFARTAWRFTLSKGLAWFLGCADLARRHIRLFRSEGQRSRGRWNAEITDPSLGFG